MTAVPHGTGNGLPRGFVRVTTTNGQRPMLVKATAVVAVAPLVFAPTELLGAIIHLKDHEFAVLETVEAVGGLLAEADR
jgi:hypothetical protein